MVMTLRPYVAREPDADALVDEIGRRSWAALDARANQWVHLLRSLDIAPGEHVAMLSGNRREAIEFAIAALHAGVMVVPASWQLDGAGLAYVLDHADIQMIVVGDREVGLARQALERTDIQRRFVLGGAADGFIRADEALTSMPTSEPEEQAAGAPMFYTSGTTGSPKGVVSAVPAEVGAPPETVTEGTRMISQGLGFPEGGVGLLTGPLFHSGQFVMALSAVLSGQRLVTRRTAEPKSILETIDSEHVTNAVLLPVDLARLLQLPDDVRGGFDGGSLVRVIHGGAQCPPEIKRGMIDWWGPVFAEYYGATEIGLITLATSAEWLERPTTVGRVLPHLEVRIVTADGRTAEPGEEGILHLRHRSGADLHYYKDPERTAAAHVVPGMFTLGDMGRFDDDGYLHISGRVADAIDIGGELIHPAVIEATLAGHAAIADVGVYQGDGGSVRAAVVPVPGHDVSDALAGELLDIVGAHLPPQADLAIEFLDELPRSAAGKILKHELRAQHATRRGA